MREYHCNTCDFHISGPADEVADEIDAHEEQHHTTDTVAESGIEVTPEILFAVSRWVFDTSLPANIAHALADAAATMRREQSDEKRIDELAQVLHRARNEAHGWTPDWSGIDELSRQGYRAGIRAVLGYMEQSRAAGEHIAMLDKISERIEQGGGS